MTDPDWAVVLDSLYNTNGFLFRSKECDVTDANIQDSQNVYHQIPLPIPDLVKALSLGRRIGLWEEEREPIQDEEDDMNAPIIKLTEKGFDVAHEREVQKQQEKHDRVITAFTVFLGLSAVFQGLAIQDAREGFLSWAIGLFLIFGAFTFLMILRGHVDFLTG